jgi:hypothetical protein
MRRGGLRQRGTGALIAANRLDHVTAHRLLIAVGGGRAVAYSV